MLRQRCAWCGTSLGCVWEWRLRWAVSHGICRPCKTEHFGKGVPS